MRRWERRRQGLSAPDQRQELPPCVAGVILMFFVLLAQTIEAKTVLTVAPWGGLGDRNQGGLMEQHIAEYEKLHPDIEIEVIGQIPTYDFLPKLLLMPDMPDVLETHLGWFPELMQAGIASPMPREMENRARRFFFAPTFQPFMAAGRLHGIPTEYQLYALGYNQRLFDEAGFAKAPQTWSELQLLATKATKRNANGSIARVGLRFAGYGWAGGGEGETHSFLALLWSNGGTYIDAEGKPGLDQPAALETMQFLTDMIRQQAALPDGWGGIPEGTTAMAIIPSWARGGFESAMGADFVNAATSLIPHGKGGFATTQYGWGFVVPAKAKHPKEAWEFLEWLTMQRSPDGLTRTGRAMAKLGSVPTSPGDLQARRELQEHSYWKGFLAGMNVARAEPNYPQIFARWKELGAALEPVLRLQVPPVQGLTDAQRRIVTALTRGVGPGAGK